MKKKISLIFLCLFISVIGSMQAKGDVKNQYNIVPLPNELTPKEGRFVLTSKVVVENLSTSKEIQAVSNDFTKKIKEVSGLNIKQVNNTKGDAPVIRFVSVKGMEKEAYLLSVTPKNITITASQSNGFFYGVQSIYQLLPAQVYGSKCVKADWSVPCVEIKDAPRFAYRGLMLDAGRHFAPIDYVYKFIDALAMHKMNTFHWHLTEDQGWRIEIKQYPKLVEVASRRDETLVGYYFENYPMIFDGKEHKGYYTQEQIKAVVAYAASKQINVIPEIEIPGHALAAIAAYPELSCTPDSTYKVGQIWGVFDQVYCPKESTFKFLENVIDEVLTLFPSKYIHIGGDECPKTAWKTCEHCQKLISDLGLKDDTTPNPIDGKKHSKEDKLQSYIITRIEKYINSKGRQIIGWDEILEGGLAPNATVMSWRGVEGGITAAKAGHDAIMTPSGYMYLDHYQENPMLAPNTIGGYTTLKKIYSYNPVPADAPELVQKHIIGVQANCWSEYMQTVERRDYQIFPRAVAIAETGWTSDSNKDWKGFCNRMGQEFDRLNAIKIGACTNFKEVTFDTHVIKDTLNVCLENNYPGASIHMTFDGSEPTAQSLNYSAPFALKDAPNYRDGNLVIKAAAFVDGKRIGKVTDKNFYGNLISGKNYSTFPIPGWSTGDTFGPNDELGGDKATQGLTNGKRGYSQSYTPWVIFGVNEKCGNEMTFIVKLDKTTNISKVIFGTLHNPGLNLRAASAAKVYVSADGSEYKEIASEKFSYNFAPNGRQYFMNTMNFAPAEALYVKVVIKGGGYIRNGIDCKKSDSRPDKFYSDLGIDEIEVY